MRLVGHRIATEIICGKKLKRIKRNSQEFFHPHVPAIMEKSKFRSMISVRGRSRQLLKQFNKYCIRRVDDSITQATVSGIRESRSPSSRPLSGKEQPPAAPSKPASSPTQDCRIFAETPGAFPPLPEGKGRGEGEARTFPMRPHNK
jgi:hypothetical protein